MSVNKPKQSTSEKEERKPVENAWQLSIAPFNEGDMKYPLQEESKFAIAFPKYREKYVRECWPLLEKVFKDYGLKIELDVIGGIMSVATTRKTWDPYIILKGRDILKLISRSVPFEQAIKVLKDNVTCEIVKIKNMVRNKERLIKRRQRLIGANGNALKALELLTDCYVLVQGCTVAAIGPYKGIQQVVHVVQSTMKNIHPVNLLKVLMVRKQLAKDPEKKNEDWTKYIPSYISRNVNRKKPKKVRKKKQYTPFPPSKPEQIIDEKLSSGQYFLSDKKMKGKGKYSKSKGSRKKSKQ